MIPDEIVQATWKEVAGFRGMQARKEMARLAKRQPDLLPFVVVETEDLSPEAHELAIFLFFVVTRIFEKHCGVARISTAVILEQFQDNINELERLAAAHDRFVERAAAGQASRQPHVMRYVVESLMEAGGGPYPVELTAEEIGTLFLVLKTVIDVLDAALKSPDQGAKNRSTRSAR
jgi:hypothetical protein